MEVFVVSRTAWSGGDPESFVYSIAGVFSDINVARVFAKEMERVHIGDWDTPSFVVEEDRNGNFAFAIQSTVQVI